MTSNMYGLAKWITVVIRFLIPPSVSLLQKTPSSPVTCHATGFYPSGVMVTWKKDGQEQHEDVEVGDTLQNDDGTFQKCVHLNVKPEEWKNNKYQCVVQVSGIRENFKDLTEYPIKDGLVRDPTTIVPIIGVAILVALFLATVSSAAGSAALAWIVIWKRRHDRHHLSEK